MDNLQGKLNVNAINFSGAMDVVCVRHADGSLVSSPFYVQFGKLGVFISNEHQVDIVVNEKPLKNISMKLLKSGIAYFENNFEKTKESDNLSVSSAKSENCLKAVRLFSKAIELIEIKCSVKHSQTGPSLKNQNLILTGFKSPKNTRNIIDDQYKCQLTSDELKQFDLNYGLNKIEYSVTSGLQGTKTISANIFLWNHTDKIVISDIDGTITKSDVMGHIAAIFKLGWYHQHVAKFFTQIERKNYKIIYLSARSICQADITRNLVRSVNQNNIQMPQGPILLNPNQIFSAFKTELIFKNSTQTKLIWLENIKELFGDGDNPFYAGIGNRETDATAYRNICIPESNIFIINSNSILTSYQNKGLSLRFMCTNINNFFP